MERSDLSLVQGWLREPHAGRWWLDSSTFEREFGAIADRVRGGSEAINLLIAEREGRPIGWCQWYRWDDQPADAGAMEALPGEIGIDYAIGEPDMVGHGVGTELIAELVGHIHAAHPGAGILTGPDARNLPSRRVLERNGFRLVTVRPVATEPTDAPIAIYRLAAAPVSRE